MDPSPPRLRFEDVYRDHLADVWRSLAALGVREADVADACQEVFVVVHRQLAGFDGAAKVTTWLYAICLRVASGFRRRAHTRREELVDVTPERAGADSPHRDLERVRAMRQLRAMLDALDDDKRSVFVLYELEELPMREVAEIVGCPLQTAYSRLHAARRTLELAARAPGSEVAP